MSHSPSLSDCCVAPCQCLVGKAEAEKDTAQKRLRVILRVESSLMDKRAVGDRIIKRKRFFEMRPGRSKPGGTQQISTGGEVTQNEPGGIVALTAQMQQILV